MFTIYLMLFCITTITIVAPQDFPSPPIGATELIEGDIAYSDKFFFSTIGPTPQERAENEGYTAETHTVTTEDGYILDVFRITGSAKSPASDTKTPLLLIHGLLDCSVTWVLGAPNKSFGFIAADNGYDVWMGSVRGSRYARNHTTWTTQDKEYWMFSWHEMGLYDLPAMIDYILNITGKSKLLYAGHSQGATIFFVMCTMRPEYQEKILAMFGLAAAVFLEHTTLPLLRILAPISTELKLLGDLIGFYEFMPTGELIQKVAKEACDDDNPVTQEICITVIVLLVSPGERLLNKTVVAEAQQYVPAGASTKQLAHFGQSMNSKKFRQYDYGPAKNMEKYGSVTPPDYPLEIVETPVYMYSGINDAFVNITDQETLHEKLPNCTKYVISDPSYTHIDFILAKPMDTELYNPMLSHMKQYK